MAFVCKQTASITLDKNNDVLPHTSVGLTNCISIVFSVLNILTHLTIMLRVGSL